MPTLAASTFIVQLVGMPKIVARTLTGTCRPLSVTTALTLPWLLSSATEKSWIVGAAAVDALAYNVHTITWVMHWSRNTVPGGAIAPGSNVVRFLTTGPSLVNDRSLMRSPTPSLSTAPSGRTWAWVPSP